MLPRSNIVRLAAGLLVLAMAAPLQAAGEQTAFSQRALPFVHFNGMSGELWFPEPLGAGAALFDMDNDGDLDLYLVQGALLGPDAGLNDTVFKPLHPLPLTDRLYRNDTPRGASGADAIVMTDVTDEAGVGGTTGYGMGVAAADFDNDGLVDLYVTNFGDNYLLRNRGNGKFEDVTAAAGVNDPRWSVSATWFDYDRDGRLDLYVGNYADFTFDNARDCYNAANVLEYCGPLSHDPQPDSLFRNLGDGRFADVSKSTGISATFGAALGVIAVDLNGDHWLDIYVANDGTANQMWLNQQDGTFVDEAMLSGTAVNMDGIPEASMGVDAADFDDDGDQDLFMTHLTRESNTLYVNDGSGFFEDLTVTSGLANTSLAYTGFGMGFFDYDNDGLLDLVIANGEVRQIDAQVRAGDPHPLKQPNQLFRNLGKMKFEEVSARAGEAFGAMEVSRGIALGDIDNDGDSDFVLTNNAGPARLFANEVGNTRPWLGARLVDKDGRADALGARAGIVNGERTSQWRRVRRDGSYASARDPRLLFSVGSKPVSLEVVWPDGEREVFAALEPGRYHQLQRGTGRAAKK